MTHGTARIVELAKLTGKIDDPKLRRMLRRLEIHPDPHLEELLLRKLAKEAGDECFDPAAFRSPAGDELAVPGDDGTRYVTWGRVARLSADAITPGAQFRLPVVCEHRIFMGKARKGKSVAVAQFLKGVLA